MGLLLESTQLELLTAAVVVVAAALYWYFTNTFDYWEKRNVPHVKPKPFFGSMGDRLLFRVSSADMWARLYRELEGHPVGGAWLVRSPIFFVRDPGLIKHVLVKDFAHFHDRGLPVDEKRNPLSAHLFNLSGGRWRKLRVKLTPTFTSGKMKMMYGLMHACSRELADFVAAEARAAGGCVEMKEILARFTTDVIGTCAFGLQMNSMKDADSQFRAMGRKVFEPSLVAVVRQIAVMTMPWLRKVVNMSLPRPEVTDFFMNAVRDTVQYREKNNVKRNDFMDLLIQLKNKGKLEDEESENSNISNGHSHEEAESHDIEMTDNLLAAQAFVFFLAGFETSSSTMSFALHELAVNPEMQTRLREEVDEVLKENDGEFTYEAVMKMEYLDRVVNESLRKYPPVAVILRVCTKRYQVPGTDIFIDEGTRVNVPAYAIHHDPKYYPDPDRFDPERFTEEEKSKRPHYTYLPFGEGPRICIGMRFGLLQAKLGLATLLSKFEFSACERTRHPLVLDPKTFVTSGIGGIWVRVSPRP